jgi:hypothetical protein
MCQGLPSISSPNPQKCCYSLLQTMKWRLRGAGTEQDRLAVDAGTRTPPCLQIPEPAFLTTSSQQQSCLSSGSGEGENWRLCPLAVPMGKLKPRDFEGLIHGKPSGLQPQSNPTTPKQAFPSELFQVCVTRARCFTGLTCEMEMMQVDLINSLNAYRAPK